MRLLLLTLLLTVALAEEMITLTPTTVEPTLLPTFLPSQQPTTLPTTPPTWGLPRIEVDPLPSPAPGVLVNVTWACIHVKNVSIVDVQLRTCDTNASNPGRQVGATLNQDGPVPACLGMQEWDTSVYAICPSTADGVYVRCVKVQVAGATEVFEPMFQPGLSNAVNLNCEYPVIANDDDGRDLPDYITFAIQKDILWLAPLVFCVVLLLAIVCCISLRRRRRHNKQQEEIEETAEEYQTLSGGGDTDEERPSSLTQSSPRVPSTVVPTFADVFFTFPWTGRDDDESTTPPRRIKSVSEATWLSRGIPFMQRRRRQHQFLDDDDLDDDDEATKEDELPRSISGASSQWTHQGCRRWCFWPKKKKKLLPGVVAPSSSSSRRGSPPGPRPKPLSPSSANLRSLVSRGLETATDDWILDYDRLHMGDMVGVGATAAVFRCTYAGATVAAKRVPCYAWDSANKAQLRREAALLARLHHPNIVRFYGIILHAQHAYLITEFVPETLATRIKENAEASRQSRRRPRFDVAEYYDLCLGTARGLEYLHARRVAHRDVKPSNVLCEGHHAKLCDFGLSKRADAAYMTNTTGVGTPAFMAPEIITGGETTTTFGDDYLDPFAAPADVFAFAMLLYCTWTCRLPFEAWNVDDDPLLETTSSTSSSSSSKLRHRMKPPFSAFALMSKIAAGERPALPDDVGRLGYLISACWAHASTARPTMAHVLIELQDLVHQGGETPSSSFPDSYDLAAIARKSLSQPGSRPGSFGRSPPLPRRPLLLGDLPGTSPLVTPRDDVIPPRGQTSPYHSSP